MEFKTLAHKEVYEKTRDHLNSLFGEVNVKSIGSLLVLQEGSTFVYVRTMPIGEKKSVVEVFSYVVMDVPVTQELMLFLLARNLKLVLGGFALSVDEGGKGTVVLSHSILGNSMDREQLYGSVSAVARVADDIDDQIVGKFGGSTALDRLVSQERLPTAEYWE